MFGISLLLRLMAAGLAFRVREHESRGTIEVMSQMMGVTPLRVLRFPVGLYRAWQNGDRNTSQNGHPEELTATVAAGEPTLTAGTGSE